MNSGWVPVKSKMESKTVIDSMFVRTVAGSGEARSGDGTGLTAAFHKPETIVYSPADDSLLITDLESNLIRRMFHTTEQQRSGLNRALASCLIETGAVSIQQLVSMIFDYTAGNGTPRTTYHRIRHCSRLVTSWCVRVWIQYRYQIR